MGIDAQMFVRTRAVVTTEQVREWAWRACAVFGRGRFSVIRPESGHEDYWPKGCRALEIVPYYGQDGPDITPEPGETLIEAFIATRYYGEGYERGDVAFLLTFAAWLERVIPGASVFYGGDSSGVCAQPFGPAEREAMLRHAASRDGARYRTISWFGGASPRCEFCDAEMTGSMSGPGVRGYHCLGCGLHTLVRDDGSSASCVDHWPEGEAHARCEREAP